MNLEEINSLRKKTDQLLGRKLSDKDNISRFVTQALKKIKLHAETAMSYNYKADDHESGKFADSVDKQMDGIIKAANEALRHVDMVNKGKR